jgi:hypothetical protein
MARSRLALLLALLAAGCGGGGTAQEGPVLGDGDAVLVVAEAVGCEPCGRFHERTLPGIVRDYVEPGDLEVRAVLLTPPDDAAARLTAAIRAAGLQDRLFDALDAAYRTPAPRTPEELLRRVEGLDVQAALDALGSEEVAAAGREDRRLAERIGLAAAQAVQAGRSLDDLAPVLAPNLSPAELAEALDAVTGRG